jgi:zinc-binding in reverse transcriptase
VHVCTVLEPPDDFVKEVTRLYVNFVWNGNHWCHPNFLFDLPSLGGHGVHHVPSRLMLLRLIFVNHMISRTRSAHNEWLTTYHLAQYNKNFPTFQSLLLEKMAENSKLRTLTPFYASVLRAWAKLDPNLAQLPTNISDIKSMSLYNSKCFENTPFSTIFDNFNWEKINCSVIGDILNCDNQVKAPGDFTTQSLSVPGTRQLTTILKTLAEHFHTIFQIRNDDETMKFSYIGRDNKTHDFLEDRKVAYEVCLQKSLPAFFLTGKCAWTDDPINWRSLYQLPIDGSDGDISWRFLHDRLVTPVRRHKWGVQPSPHCPWCITPGTAMHMLFECPMTDRIWQIVRIFHRKITNKSSIANLLPISVLINGLPSTDNNNTMLTNFLITLAKSTIYRTYSHYLRTANLPAPQYHTIFTRRLRFRLTLEISKFRQKFPHSDPTLAKEWWNNKSVMSYKNGKLYCFF